jgi:hypothetical protein
MCPRFAQQWWCNHGHTIAKDQKLDVLEQTLVISFNSSHILCFLGEFQILTMHRSAIFLCHRKQMIKFWGTDVIENRRCALRHRFKMKADHISALKRQIQIYKLNWNKGWIRSAIFKINSTQPSNPIPGPTLKAAQAAELLLTSFRLTGAVRVAADIHERHNYGHGTFMRSHHKLEKQSEKHFTSQKNDVTLVIPIRM